MMCKECKDSTPYAEIAVGVPTNLAIIGLGQGREANYVVTEGPVAGQ